MGNALKFKHTQVPRQHGEQARLKVVQGPDFGAIFVFTGTKITVGRGEENDVVVTDLKASRKHAEFLAQAGGWAVRDAGSANGILYNGNAAKTAKLKTGDTITLGETTFEFMASEAATMMLVAPPKTMSQVQAEQSALSAQKLRVQALGLFGHGSNGSASGSGAQGLLKNRKLLLVGGVALAALMLFGPSDSKPKPQAKKTKEESRDLASYLPPGDAGGQAKTAEMFFKAGFREYRAGNYIRARTQFETVLQMSPGHRLATMYRTNCENSIKEEVKLHLARGKTGMDSGKLKEAKSHFEAVMRLLYRDQTNPSFIEAKDQAEKVTQMINEPGGNS